MLEQMINCPSCNNLVSTLTDWTILSPEEETSFKCRHCECLFTEKKIYKMGITLVYCFECKKCKLVRGLYYKTIVTIKAYCLFKNFEIKPFHYKCLEFEPS